MEEGVCVSEGRLSSKHSQHLVTNSFFELILHVKWGFEASWAILKEREHLPVPPPSRTPSSICLGTTWIVNHPHQHPLKQNTSHWQCSWNTVLSDPIMHAKVLPKTVPCKVGKNVNRLHPRALCQFQVCARISFKMPFILDTIHAQSSWQEVI